MKQLKVYKNQFCNLLNLNIHLFLMSVLYFKLFLMFTSNFRLKANFDEYKYICVHLVFRGAFGGKNYFYYVAFVKRKNATLSYTRKGTNDKACPVICAE